MSEHGGGGGHYGGGMHYGHGGHYGHASHHGQATAPPAYPAPPPGSYRGKARVASAYYGADWPYADWGSRVAACLLDILSVLVPVVLAVFAGGIVGLITKSAGTGATVIMVFSAAALVQFSYDRYVRAGKTGQSFGKRVAGLRLADERTGQPIGPATALGRDLAHLVDGITFFIGYLAPLWDRKRQTFADKIAHTVVVRSRD